MTACIVLAAGRGKRMKSVLPKVLHPVLGVPMVARVLEQAELAGFDEIVVVVGHGRDEVVGLVEEHGASWEVQEEQLGTAHAVACGLRNLSADSVVVLLGDVPLLESSTISMLEEARKEADAAVAVLTAEPPDPSGYGRIVRDGERLLAIVEHRDCTPAQRKIREINTGMMSFDGKLLPALLERVDSGNDQGEYYLTDTVAEAVAMGRMCIAVKAGDYMEVSGVNDRVQLARATEFLRTKVAGRHMLAGVDIPDPGSVWIEEAVEISGDVHLGRFVRLSGSTSVGPGCRLGDGCILVDHRLPGGTVLAPYTVLERGGRK